MSDLGKDDRSLESIDFVIDILKEHERSIDKAIACLQDILEKLEKNADISEKIDEIQRKLDGLEKDVAALARYCYSKER